jgi:uncharacterized membrane protein YkvI
MQLLYGQVMPPKTLHQVFKWPLFIGVFTAIGLIVALIYDQHLETIALGLLSIPIMVILYVYMFHHLRR